MKNTIYIYTRTLHCSLLQLIKERKGLPSWSCFKVEITHLSSLSLSVNILLLRSAQTEMVAGPHETLQMGQLVPYCGPSHPDGKMSQKCQGKPSWLHSRYSSVIHHWTTPKKRPNSPKLHSSAATVGISAQLPLIRLRFNILFACFSRFKSITSWELYLLDSSVHLLEKQSSRPQIFSY